VLGCLWVLVVSGYYWVVSVCIVLVLSGCSGGSRCWVATGCWVVSGCFVLGVGLFLVCLEVLGSGWVVSSGCWVVIGCWVVSGFVLDVGLLLVCDLVV